MIQSSVESTRAWGHQALFPRGIVDLKNAVAAGDIGPQRLHVSGAVAVVGLKEFIKVGAFEGLTLDDVVAGRVDQRDLRVLVFLRRKHPPSLKGGYGDQPQQHRRLRRVRIRRPQRDGTAECDGLNGVDGIGIDPGHVHRVVPLGERVKSIAEQSDICVGDGIVLRLPGMGDGRKARQVIAASEQYVRHDFGRGDGVANKRDGLLGRHAVCVDIVAPAVANLLLADEVIGGHALHGHRHALKGFGLGRKHSPLFNADIHQNKRQEWPAQ